MDLWLLVPIEPNPTEPDRDEDDQDRVFEKFKDLIKTPHIQYWKLMLIMSCTSKHFQIKESLLHAIGCGIHVWVYV